MGWGPTARRWIRNRKRGGKRVASWQHRGGAHSADSGKAAHYVEKGTHCQRIQDSGALSTSPTTEVCGQFRYCVHQVLKVKRGTREHELSVDPYQV